MIPAAIERRARWVLDSVGGGDIDVADAPAELLEQAFSALARLEERLASTGGAVVYRIEDRRSDTGA
jgi:hypothetical protein